MKSEEEADNTPSEMEDVIIDLSEMDGEFIVSCEDTGNFTDVTESVVTSVTKIWTEYEDRYSAGNLDNPDKCLESLLVCTAKIIFNGQYSHKVTNRSLKDELKTVVQKCGKCLEDSPTRRNICVGLSSIIVDPWRSDAFNAVATSGGKSVLNIPKEAADNLWNTEGWAMLETRLDYLVKIGKKCIDRVCSVLHILAKQGHQLYASRDPDENCSDENTSSDPYKFPFSKYLEYLEVYAILVFKDFIDVQMLTSWDESIFLKVIDGLLEKAHDQNRKRLFPKLKFWKEVEDAVKYLMKTVAWFSLKSKKTEVCQKFFCKWVQVCVPVPTDGLAFLNEVIDKLDDVVTTHNLYGLANATIETIGKTEITRPKFVEIYVRALTKDMNTIEAEKTVLPYDNEKIRQLDKQLSFRYLGLAKFFCDYPHTVRACLLTAFSLFPCQELFSCLFPCSESDIAILEDATNRFGGNDLVKIKDSQLNLQGTYIEEDLQLTPALCDDLDTVIQNPQYKGLFRWNTDTEQKEQCRNLLMQKSVDAIENKPLEFVNVDYDKYKDLPSQYDPDDDGIEKGYRVGERRGRPAKAKCLMNKKNKKRPSVKSKVKKGKMHIARMVRNAALSDFKENLATNSKARNQQQVRKLLVKDRKKKLSIGVRKGRPPKHISGAEVKGKAKRCEKVKEGSCYYKKLISQEERSIANMNLSRLPWANHESNADSQENLSHAELYIKFVSRDLYDCKERHSGRKYECELKSLIRSQPTMGPSTFPLIDPGKPESSAWNIIKAEEIVGDNIGSKTEDFEFAGMDMSQSVESLTNTHDVKRHTEMNVMQEYVDNQVESNSFPISSWPMVTFDEAFPSNEPNKINENILFTIIKNHLQAGPVAEKRKCKRLNPYARLPKVKVNQDVQEKAQRQNTVNGETCSTSQEFSEFNTSEYNDAEMQLEPGPYETLNIPSTPIPPSPTSEDIKDHFPIPEVAPNCAFQIMRIYTKGDEPSRNDKDVNCPQRRKSIVGASTKKSPTKEQLTKWEATIGEVSQVEQDSSQIGTQQCLAAPTLNFNTPSPSIVNSVPKQPEELQLKKQELPRTYRSYQNNGRTKKRLVIQSSWNNSRTLELDSIGACSSSHMVNSTPSDNNQTQAVLFGKSETFDSENVSLHSGTFMNPEVRLQNENMQLSKPDLIEKVNESLKIGNDISTPAHTCGTPEKKTAQMSGNTSDNNGSKNQQSVCNTTTEFGSSDLNINVSVTTEYIQSKASPMNNNSNYPNLDVTTKTSNISDACLENPTVNKDNNTLQFSIPTVSVATVEAGVENASSSATLSVNLQESLNECRYSPPANTGSTQNSDLKNDPVDNIPSFKNCDSQISQLPSPSDTPNKQGSGGNSQTVSLNLFGNKPMLAFMSNFAKKTITVGNPDYAKAASSHKQNPSEQSAGLESNKNQTDDTEIDDKVHISCSNLKESNETETATMDKISVDYMRNEDSGVDYHQQKDSVESDLDGIDMKRSTIIDQVVGDVVDQVVQQLELATDSVEGTLAVDPASSETIVEQCEPTVVEKGLESTIDKNDTLDFASCPCFVDETRPDADDIAKCMNPPPTPPHNDAWPIAQSQSMNDCVQPKVCILKSDGEPETSVNVDDFTKVENEDENCQIDDYSEQYEVAREVLRNLLDIIEKRNDPTKFSSETLKIEESDTGFKMEESDVECNNTVQTDFTNLIDDVNEVNDDRNGLTTHCNALQLAGERAENISTEAEDRNECFWESKSLLTATIPSINITTSTVVITKDEYNLHSGESALTSENLNAQKCESPCTDRDEDDISTVCVSLSDSEECELIFDEGHSKNTDYNREGSTSRVSSKNEFKIPGRITTVDELELFINNKLKSKTSRKYDDDKIKIAPSVVQHLQNYGHPLHSLVFCFVRVQKLLDKDIPPNARKRINPVKRSSRIKSKKMRTIQVIKSALNCTNAIIGEDSEESSPSRSSSPDVEIINEVINSQFKKSQRNSQNKDPADVVPLVETSNNMHITDYTPTSRRRGRSRKEPEACMPNQASRGKAPSESAAKNGILKRKRGYIQSRNTKKLKPSVSKQPCDDSDNDTRDPDFQPFLNQSDSDSESFLSCNATNDGVNKDEADNIAANLVEFAAEYPQMNFSASSPIEVTVEDNDVDPLALDNFHVSPDATTPDVNKARIPVQVDEIVLDSDESDCVEDYGSPDIPPVESHGVGNLKQSQHSQSEHTHTLEHFITPTNIIEENEKSRAVDCLNKANPDDQAVLDNSTFDETTTSGDVVELCESADDASTYEPPNLFSSCISASVTVCEAVTAMEGGGSSSNDYGGASTENISDKKIELSDENCLTSKDSSLPFVKKLGSPPCVNITDETTTIESDDPADTTQEDMSLVDCNADCIDSAKMQLDSNLQGQEIIDLSEEETCLHYKNSSLPLPDNAEKLDSPLPVNITDNDETETTTAESNDLANTTQVDLPLVHYSSDCINDSAQEQLQGQEDDREIFVSHVISNENFPVKEDSTELNQTRLDSPELPILHPATNDAFEKFLSDDEAPEIEKEIS